jgi:two-component system, NarL family, sensor histidine kinase EvgS
LRRLVSEASQFMAIMLCTSLIFLASKALAQTEQGGPVRMAYMENKPYLFTDTDGLPKGLAIDLAKRLVGALDRELEFVAVENPAAMVSMVAAGDVDLTGLLALSPARSQRANATLPLGSFRRNLFVRKAQGSLGLRDFAGARIGVQQGAVLNGIPDAQPMIYSTHEELIIALLKEEVDAIASGEDGLSASLREMGIDVLAKTIEPPLTILPFGFYVAKDQSDLLRALNLEISTNFTEKEYLALNEIWFGSPTRLPEHELIFWGSIAGPILLVLAVVGLIGWQVHRLRSRIYQKESEQQRLFVDALDGVKAAVVIYDKNLKALHWNTGFSDSFPGLADVLVKGVTLREMIVKSYENGTVETEMNQADIDVFSNNIVESVVAGKKMNRIVYTRDGRVVEATDFPIGEDHYASVRVDVTKMHKQAETILAQKSELMAVNEKLGTFTSIAAHDLKSPLLQQMSLVEFIQEDIAEEGLELPEEVNKYFTMLSAASDKMLRLINDLLQHAHATSDESRSERFLPNDRISEALLLSGLPSRFKVEVEPGIPAVCVDPIAFDTVIRNLVSNAVKHHDRDEGVIKISGSKSMNMVSIKIEDDGPGVPEEYRTTIFEPFKRLSTQVDGSGLGLSFVDKTVAEWGGSIYVECPNARGSIFVIALPAENAQEQMASDDVQQSKAS